MDITKETYEREDVVDSYYHRYFNKYGDKDYFDINFSEYVDKLAGNKLVLDVGCGPGIHAKKLADLGADVLGIDYSKAMIKKARNLYDEGSNLKFKEMDLFDITDNFGKNSFDGIWCTAVLLHINKSKVSRVLMDFHELLTDKGLLFLIIKKGNLETAILKGDDLGENVFRKFSFWNEGKFDNLLEDTGFVVLNKWEKRGSVTKGVPTSWLRYLARKK